VSVVVGVLGGAYLADQLVRPLVGEHVEQAGPVEQVELLDSGGCAVGEQRGSSYPVRSAQGAVPVTAR
jgi:hypothetical protein